MERLSELEAELEVKSTKIIDSEGIRNCRCPFGIINTFVPLPSLVSLDSIFFF